MVECGNAHIKAILNKRGYRTGVEGKSEDVLFLWEMIAEEIMSNLREKMTDEEAKTIMLKSFFFGMNHADRAENSADRTEESDV